MNIPDSTTPAPAPQAPDFDVIAGGLVEDAALFGGWVCYGDAPYKLRDAIAAALRNAYAAGQSRPVADFFDRRYPCPHCKAMGRDGLLYPVLNCADHGSFVPAFNDRPPRLTPAEQALIDAARAYAAQYARGEVMQSAIDAALAACRALAESEAANV